MKESFVAKKRFNATSRGVIDHANIVIDEQAAEGFKLTLRQLYYELVRRNILANSVKDYKRLGNAITDARIAGLIDWDALEDRLSNFRRLTHYESEREFAEQIAPTYARNLWATQKAYCEVWIEKESLTGVVEPTCMAYRVPLFASRGYASTSALYEAGVRLRRQIAVGKRVVVFHLGDFDPTSLQRTKDMTERLAIFAKSTEIEVRRLSLTREQVDYYTLPCDPVSTDQLGQQTWELEALPCRIIVGIMKSSIADLVDGPAFMALAKQEQEERDYLVSSFAELDL